MSIYEMPEAKLDPKEEVLLAFKHGAFDVVSDDIMAGFAAGRSPGVLSIVRPDLLIEFAEALDTGEAPAASPEDEVKAAFFDEFMCDAAEGDPAAISTLPKFVTTPGQLATAMGLVLDHRDAVSEWRTGRPYVQLIGSFNPQHIGHRFTMGAALAAAGDNASVTAQVVANHPVKKDSLPPYEGRFRMGERNLYRSSFIDPRRVTLVDVPVGPGLSKMGAAQIELMADICGDPSMRWLMGSDKFMSDVKTAHGDDTSKRAITRFSEPRMHLYVARRATHDRAEIEEGINFIRERFGTDITLIDEAPSPMVLASAASKIRQLREEGRDEEADRLQFADLQQPTAAAA